MADWKKIKTEYITTETSYRKLAKKYGVGYQAICHRSQAEGWIAMREQHRNKTISKTIDRISEKQADKMSRIDDLADQLLEKLEQAITELDMAIVTRKEKVVTANVETTTEWKEASEVGTVSRTGLRQLTAALKDIKEVKMLRTELDRQEQEARIANLRKQANPNAGKETPALIVEGLPEEFKV